MPVFETFVGSNFLSTLLKMFYKFKQPTVLLLLLGGYVMNCYSTPVQRATGYVQYLTGTGLNVILSAPHGGTETPAEIPDRDAGCWTGSQCIWSHTCGTKDPINCAATTARDVSTSELTQELRDALCNRFGKCPPAIINLLHRRKLDANRDQDEATFGVPLAVEAFDEYHRFIEMEKNSFSGKGLFIDIHGHGHTIQRAELGYLLTSAQLNSANDPSPDITSIRDLYGVVGGNFDDLLRGATSFGGLMEDEGFAAVPSPKNRGPGIAPYFSGGYNTRVHGSVNGGPIDAIQIESPRSFRDLPLRTAYVDALVNVIANYLAQYYPDEI